MKHLFVTLFCLVLVAAVCSCERTETGTAATQPSGARKRIAVIPKGTTHAFWKSVEAGARRAAEELDVEIIWKGPLREDDRAEQIKVIEQFVSEGVDGICLAPLDTEALARPVASAMGRKTRVSAASCQVQARRAQWLPK